MRGGWGKTKSIVKFFDSMLKQHQYEKMAADFQVNVGIAEWTEPFYGNWTSIKKMPDELKVILLTNHMIEIGKYQQCIKEVYRLKQKYGKRNIKESTIYEKAITNITEG